MLLQQSQPLHLLTFMLVLWSAIDEATLFHHMGVYCTAAKQEVPKFLQLLSKRIKALGTSDNAKRLSYLRQKAMLERSIGNNALGLTEAQSLGSKLPKGFERYIVSMKRIKALSLHAMGSKKALSLARELTALPEMKGDADLLAILEQGNHVQEDDGDVLLKEKLIPNPNLHSSFIENSIKNHSVSPDLLDVVSLETLGGIMARWWEKCFCRIFRKQIVLWLLEREALTPKDCTGCDCSCTRRISEQ